LHFSGEINNSFFLVLFRRRGDDDGDGDGDDGVDGDENDVCDDTVIDVGDDGGEVDDDEKE